MLHFQPSLSCVLLVLYNSGHHRVVYLFVFSYISVLILKEKMSFLGLGFSLGTVPVCHGAKHKVLDRRVRITKLVLRCVSLGLGVVAIVLVVTDSQVKEFFSFQKKAKFTDMKALM
ncbi:hypothetical protein AAZX31_02G161300 [Glycine max]